MAFEVDSLDCGRQARDGSSLAEDPMAVVELHTAAVLEARHMVVVASEAAVGMARGCIEEGLVW